MRQKRTRRRGRTLALHRVGADAERELAMRAVSGSCGAEAHNVAAEDVDVAQAFT